MKQFFAWVPLLPPPTQSNAPALQRAAALGAIVVFAGGLAQAFLVPNPDSGQAWIVYLPLMASALVFGFPHGAIDHLVALGLSGRALKPAPFLCVTGIYLLLAILFAIIWLIAPSIALAAFLLITVVHWGRADSIFEVIMVPDGPLRNIPHLRPFHSALRGVIPIGIPFLAFPEESAAFVASTTDLFAASPPDLEGVRPIITALLLTLVLAETLIFLRVRTRAGLRLLAESLGLGLYFATVPPLVAIGWYFCFWHGLRHVLRLCRYQPSGTSRNKALPPHPIRLFYRRALPFTMLPLVFLLWIGLSGIDENGPARWMAQYLVLVSALTFPHMILVEWMDRRETENARRGTDPKLIESP
jgi:Brp/Blh family beta-carotene 15,15'-monooxygenase